MINKRRALLTHIATIHACQLSKRHVMVTYWACIINNNTSNLYPADGRVGSSGQRLVNDWQWQWNGLFPLMGEQFDHCADFWEVSSNYS